MSITIHPTLEAALRSRAEAEGLTVEAYLEQLVRADEAAAEELEELVRGGINSGEPVQVGPDYWEEKHRRLDQRLKNKDKR